MGDRGTRLAGPIVSYSGDVGGFVVRAGWLIAVTAVGATLAPACTSDHGALPAPTAPVTRPSTDERSDDAARARLQRGDLPTGFMTSDANAAARWEEILTEAEQLTPVRPGCEESLASIGAELSVIPPDAAGVVFDDGEGREILHFTAIVDAAAAQDLVQRIGALNARCDAYTLQVADRGSIDLIVTPFDVPEAAADPAVTAVAWEVTILSSGLRRTDYRAALAVNGLVSLVAATGDPALAREEFAEVVSAAVERARTAEQ